MIYNGDADACVPYIGNEVICRRNTHVSCPSACRSEFCRHGLRQEWLGDLQTSGVISEAEPWRPWFTASTPSMPAGYVTTYNVT